MVQKWVITVTWNRPAGSTTLNVLEIHYPRT